MLLHWKCVDHICKEITIENTQFSKLKTWIPHSGYRCEKDLYHSRNGWSKRLNRPTGQNFVRDLTSLTLPQGRFMAGQNFKN